MAIYPPGFGNNTGETVEELTSSFPTREVFIKDNDNSIIGTGMRLLPDGSLLAPEGFSVESGSIDFGDVITLSESAGFLGLRNNLNNEMYQVVDYHIPRSAPSDNPRIFQLIEAEWMNVAQPDSSVALTANPLIYNFTTVLDARTNSITFKASSAMTNVRIRIMKSDVNVALKYLPTKSSWLLGTGGYSFVAGDNVIDFKDSPVPLSSGTMLTFEIRATNIALQGNLSGLPYFGVMTQRGVYQYLPLSVEVTPEAIRGKLETLVSPNKLPKTAVQDAVLSVNSKFGDVALSNTDVGAQAQDSTLQEIADLTIVNNSLLHINATGHVDQIPITAAGKDWLTYTSADNQKAQLGLATVASSGSYNDLTDKPTIPSAQIQSDWNQATTSALDYIKNKPTIPTVNYPVTSVNTKTGAVVLNNTDVGAAATVHTHVINDVTGLQTALDAKFAIPAGTVLQYVRGNGSLATFPTAVSVFTNDSGYLTTITSSQVTTALGFTPYNATNPSSYINQAGARTAISLTTTGTSGAATYNSSTGVLNVPNYANSGGTVTSVIAGTGLSGGTITTTGTISMPNVGTAGSYNGTVTTDAQGRVTAGTNRTFTNPTRSLNASFQPSTTQDSIVSYSVDIACSAALLAGQAGRVILEYANDSAFTISVTTVQQATGSAGGVLNLATVTTASLTGCVPANKFVRLRTVNVNGTPTFTYQSAQEVLLG